MILSDSNQINSVLLTMAVTEIVSDGQFTDVTTSVSPETLVLVYFHTPWADPCVQMNSVFSSLSDMYPQYQFLSVNADDFPDISESFDVSAVPFIVFLKNKTIVQELSGANPKELAATIQKFSGDGGAPVAGGDASGVAQGQQQSSATKSESAIGKAGIGAAVPEQESQEELNKRLIKLTNAAPVMLFMKGTPAEPRCGFSRQLVKILRDHQVRFGFFDILKDNSVREGLKVLSDWPTFPQLYIKGELQGGLDIIRESVEEDPDFFKNATQ